MAAGQVLEMPVGNAVHVAAEPLEVKLTNQAMTWPEKARAIEITDAPSYQLACNELLGIKALRGEVETTFGPIVSSAHGTWKEALAGRKRADDPLNEAESILKQRIGTYQQEQRRIAQEAERQARIEAERLALEAREVEIEEAEAQGASVQEVATIIERPVVHFTPPPVRAAVPVVQGVSMRETWAAEVTDVAALVRYAAANPQYVSLLTPNMTAINQMARAMKSTMDFPGVRVFMNSNVAARRG